MMVRSNLLCPRKEVDNELSGCIKSATEVGGDFMEAGTKRKAPDMANTGTSNEDSSNMANVWQEALRKDLDNRNPAMVVDDLGSILCEYGIQVSSTQKKSKLV